MPHQPIRLRGHFAPHIVFAKALHAPAQKASPLNWLRQHIKRRAEKSDPVISKHIAAAR
jgi:hypothetical protein